MSKVKKRIILVLFVWIILAIIVNGAIRTWGLLGSDGAFVIAAISLSGIVVLCVAGMGLD
jgi:hypothetical protein